MTKWFIQERRCCVCLVWWVKHWSLANIEGFTLYSHKQQTKQPKGNSFLHQRHQEKPQISICNRLPFCTPFLKILPHIYWCVMCVLWWLVKKCLYKFASMEAHGPRKTKLSPTVILHALLTSFYGVQFWGKWYRVKVELFATDTTSPSRLYQVVTQITSFILTNL